MPEKRVLPSPLDSVGGESPIEQHDEKKVKVEDTCSSNDDSTSAIMRFNPSASTSNHNIDQQQQRPVAIKSQSGSMLPQTSQLGDVPSRIPKAEQNGDIISNMNQDPNPAVGNKSNSDSTLTSSDSSGRKDMVSSASAPLHSSYGSMNTPVTSEMAEDYGVTNLTVGIDGRDDSSSAVDSRQSDPSQTTGMGSKKESPIPPLKSTKMRHLMKKYMPQLEYMHREFKKLERQLLGAKSSAKGFTESAGSRERREKLHSFIVHLEETMNQIHVGCELEQGGRKKSLDGSDISATSFSGNSSAQASIHSLETDPSQHASESNQAHSQSLEEEESKREFARSAALTKLTKEKELEENVQKLEEHILANLLPVKERLTKQLAAQQGAVKNPIGMPARRGLQTQRTACREAGASDSSGNEAPRSVHASSVPPTGPITGPAILSQFGKPLKGGGSSLTQKLHGKTLGSQRYIQGQKVAGDKGAIGTQTASRKVIYAGMTPGSGQVQSGVSAATGVHNMVIESSRHRLAIAETFAKDKVSAPLPPPPPPVAKISNNLSVGPTNAQKHPQHVTLSQKLNVNPRTQSMTTKSGNIINDHELVHATAVPQIGAKEVKDEQNQEKLKKNVIHQLDFQQSAIDRQQQLGTLQAEALPLSRKGMKSSAGHRVCSHPRKGPRAVEYICALCNETYKSTCEYNPWWALSSHECAKCGKIQIPRLDISSPANAIDYHPALLVHATADESSKGSSKPVAVSSVSKQGLQTSEELMEQDEDNEGSVMDDIDDKDSFDSDSDESGFEENTQTTQAQNEDFGEKYSGPKFNEYDASRLLVLMGHAATCPGRHEHEKHRECCTNVKFMMLHVRDCPGTTSSNDICPFPWCRKTKHLLYHLISCPSSDNCKICTPIHLSRNFTALKGLNEYRSQKRKELHSGQQPASHISSKSADTNSPTKGNEFHSNIRKVAAQRKGSRSSVATSVVRPVARSTKVHQHIPSSTSIPRSKDATKLSVPSPIPTAGLSSSKPNDPLSLAQSQTLTERVKHMTSKPKTTYLSSKTTIRQDLVATKRPASQGIGNPLNILNPCASYPAPKISSPPNPLKGLPSDHSAIPGTNFPTLPTPISINDNGGNANPMRKVKVESEQ